MDEIRKYSREWFAAYASADTKNSAKKLKDGVESNAEGMFKNPFEGDKEEVLEWLDIMPNSSELRTLMDTYGGFDNLFELIDTDHDGILTQDEAKAIAGADTPDDEERLDKRFSTKDLQSVYENVMAADEAEVQQTENTKKYTFKDGSTTEVEYDNNGTIIKATTEKFDENGQSVKKVFDKDGKLLEVSSGNGEKKDVVLQGNLKVKNTTDDQGRVIKTEIEGKLRSEQKTIDIEYHKDGSKTVTTDTIGQTKIEKFDKNEKLISSEMITKYDNIDDSVGNLNGVIGPSQQGSAGDCWLLAGVNALARTDAGSQVIKDAIHKNSDGTVTITLKGADRTYTYTPEQIMSYEYASSLTATATGDLDMNLIEMAVSDYRREILSKPENEIPRAMRGASSRSPLEGGNGEEIMKYLTGKRGTTSSDPDKIARNIENFEKDPQRYGLVVNFNNSDPEIYSEEALELFGDFFKDSVPDIITGHAYTVSRVDKNNIYLLDPRDSAWEIKYPRDKFFANVGSSSVLDLNQ